VPEEGIIVEGMEVIPPPLEERKVAEILELDEDAVHSCAVEPFRTEISGLVSTTARIALRKDGIALEEVGVGYLPQGIDVVFMKSGAYLYRPGTDETSLELEIRSRENSQKGDFNIPIIYTRKGIRDSSVVCQLNIVNR